MNHAAARFPRDTTRQAEELVYGELAIALNRVTGLIILAFVVVHIVAQTILRVPAFGTLKAGLPWLDTIQGRPWINAVLFAAIVFHTLYGCKLIALDLGMRINYRLSLWVIIGASALVACRELLRYAGI